MSEKFDFERSWMEKFARCLKEVAGDDACSRVMTGGDSLDDNSSPEDVIAWSRGAMERLEGLVAKEADRRAIMTGCACHYSKELLHPVREAYSRTGNVDLAVSMLQEQFVSFLRDGLGLGEGLIENIVERGWGLAGVRHGDTVVATKIPKSGYLEAYLQEPDPDHRRAMYCHCPRVRDAVHLGEELSPTYCYCGAGFYQDIWQEITQGPVEVELLESVMAGDEVCTVAIHLRAAAPAVP
jgi:hypothetical protein